MKATETATVRIGILDDKVLMNTDIVNEVVDNLSHEVARAMLKSAVASRLRDSLPDPRYHSPEEAIEKLCHKAQSLMEPSAALKFSERMLDLGIDCRMKSRGPAPRRKIQDFMDRYDPNNR